MFAKKIPHALREPVRRLLVARRQRALIEGRLGALTRAEQDPGQRLLQLLDQLRREPERQYFTKGEPAIDKYKRQAGEEMTELLASASSGMTDAVSDTLMRKARRLAGLDMYDARGLEVFLSTFFLTHHAMIAALRAHLRAHVILHVSCQPRLGRAQGSVQSFESLPAADCCQLVVTGEPGALFRFDALEGRLRVPAPDSYEDLPGKVGSALALLALCGGVKAVLKVDDDHRLKDPALAMRTLKQAGVFRRPAMFGRIHLAGGYGSHNRCWHIGKCQDGDINEEPYSYMGPLAWMAGESGYIVNGAGLARMLWAYVYFRQYLESGLYEDMVVSDMLNRLGGALRARDLARFLGVMSDY